MLLLAVLQMEKHVHVPVEACENLTHWWKIPQQINYYSLNICPHCKASSKKEGGLIKMRP